MRKRTVAAVLCLAAAAAPAADIDYAEMRAALVFGHGTGDTGTLQTTLELTPAIEADLGAGTRLVLSSRLRWDGDDGLIPGKPDTSTYSPLSRPWAAGDSASAELRDAYLEFGLETGLLRVGKQQIVWGALDGLKILDALDPQSFREFILEDFGDSRIGLWSVYADLSLGAWRAELAWIPDATGHEIPTDGAWFELTAPRFRYGAPPGSPRPPTTTERPGLGAADAATGLRLSRRLAGWDLSLVALTGQDHEPLGRVRPGAEGPVLERYYERRELYGLSAAKAFGRIALRTELAIRPGRRFNLRDGARLGSDRLDQYTVGLGMDIEGPWDTFVNLQYVVDRVQSAPPALVRPATDRLVTAFLRRQFAYQTVTAELRWYGDIDAGDGLVRASLSRLIGDETTVRLGLDAFYGVSDGLFGQFADRDRVTLSLEHVF